MHLCTHDRLRAASVEELETEDWLKYLVQQPCSNSSSPGSRDQAITLIENRPLEINGCNGDFATVVVLGAHRPSDVTHVTDIARSFV